MVGACIGFVGIIGVRVLVLGDSFDGLHSKFAETGMLETVGVSLLAILILLFSIFLQVLLHEGGHLVCGLATGYRFVSFRIFNLTFIRKDGKLCIKRFSLAGTGGQCLLTPPERPLEDIPTTLYNLGGVLANLLTAILAFLPLLTVDGLPYLLKFFLLMLSLIGILLAGMNGIPMKMGASAMMPTTCACFSRTARASRHWSPSCASTHWCKRACVLRTCLPNGSAKRKTSTTKMPCRSP